MPGLSRPLFSRTALALVLLVNVALFLGARQDVAQAMDITERATHLRTLAESGESAALVALRRELQQTQEEIGAATLVFAAKPDGLALQDHVLRAAALNRVELTGLALQTGAAGGETPALTPAMALAVTGRGEPQPVLAFLAQVARNPYPASVIERVHMAETAGRWVFQFNLTVFSPAPARTAATPAAAEPAAGSPRLPVIPLPAGTPLLPLPGSLPMLPVPLGTPATQGRFP